ncbi:MAG: alanine racemase [Pontibacterium sp.]
MARAATATIYLDAIRHNYRLAKQAHTAGKALAIIKANGYGHGAVKVAKALAPEADGFGVACIEEALELREAGINQPILLLEGFFSADELPTISEQSLWCAVHSFDQIEFIAKAQLSKPINVWLKMDSGMHRLGVKPSEYAKAYARLRALDNVSDIILMSHFACADEPQSKVTSTQIATFFEASQGINAPISLANSAGLMAHKDARADWQRAGIMLYGATPFADSQSIADQLKPAMSLTSQVIAMREVPAGESVGYGATWTSDAPRLIATVAMGYADGYPRHAQNGTPVLVDGYRVSLTGRVSMDMLSVDVTDVPNVHVGSHVELWGQNLKAAEVASYCDTIPYTLFTGITRRVHKRYL